MSFEHPDNNIAKQKKEEQTQDPDLDLKKYLQQSMNFSETELATINVLEIKNLPDSYFHQFALFNDARLDRVKVAVIPDKLWQKGGQTTESSADNQLIKIKEGYFNDQENSDKLGWFTHELAHCQKYLDKPDEYQKQSQKPALPELQSGGTYPNNEVELYAFTKQFEFLKGKGKAKEQIWQDLLKEYPQWAWEFLQKVLDRVYK